MVDGSMILMLWKCEKYYVFPLKHEDLNFV